MGAFSKSITKEGLNMIRIVERFQTFDGKLFESEQKAKKHAIENIENLMGALIDYSLVGVTFGPKDKLKMLENMMKDKGHIVELIESVKNFMEFD